MSTDINNELTQLWSKTFTEKDTVMVPLYYRDLRRNCLLFVGFNPSFNEEMFRKYLSGSRYSSLDISDFFLWRSKIESKIESYKEIDKIVGEKHPYFNKVKEIGEEVNLPVEHIDLFFYRKTSQKELQDLLYNKEKLNQFAEKQLSLSFRLIQGTTPEIIVVINAGASEIIRNKFGTRIQFHEEYGYHTILLNDKPVPIFFSSMLSGQRALDKGSLERLRWHVRQAARRITIT
jgi:hypothetical protein